jgi:hypothetical protein
MDFMFELQKQYLTSERSERVRYCFWHENIKLIRIFSQPFNVLFIKWTYSEWQKYTQRRHVNKHAKDQFKSDIF